MPNERSSPLASLIALPFAIIGVIVYLPIILLSSKHTSLDTERVVTQKAFATFNKPLVLPVYKYATVKAIVYTDAAESGSIVQELMSEIPASDKVETKKIIIGKYIKAELKGPDELIKIDPVDTNVVRFEKGKSVTWVWSIMAKKEGKIHITLSLFSKDSPKDETVRPPERVMSEDWVAEATGLDWWKYQVSEWTPIGIALDGLGGSAAAILGWLGFSSLGRKSSEA